jgi:drug/metabolite transporter (DMT)-like permease
MFNFRLLLVAIIWGVNFAVVKYALTDFLPLSFTVVRFLLAALFLFAIMLITREPFSIDRQDRFALIKLGFIGITLYNLFFMYGLKYTTASNSALFISLSPLFAVIIQAASGKERLTARIAVGLMLATTGVALIIKSHDAGSTFSSSELAGDLLTLIGAFLWALYTVSAQPILKKHSATKVTAYSMLAGSVLLIPISTYELIHQPWAMISVQSWSCLGFAAFISGGIAFSLWYQGVQQLGVTRTVAYHYLVPCVAVVFAALFLGERITALQIIGGLTVLCGVYLVQTKS